jgi:hypothetical protein
VVTFPPLGFTVAFKVAEVCMIDDALPVTTVGRFGSVVNVASSPLLVPAALVAEIRKWYSVFAVRPGLRTGADTATGVEPAPGNAEHGTGGERYPAVSPYSNLHSVTFSPSGFTVAFRVAEVCVIAVALPVTTVGSTANAGAATTAATTNNREVTSAASMAPLAT